MVLPGCPRSGSDGTEPGREAFPPDAKLRVLVVGDPALATAVEQLRGQWKLQTGTSFEVYEKPDLDSAAANPPEADAIIAASHYLGALAEKKWIVPVPQGLIGGQDPRAAKETEGKTRSEGLGRWADLFTLLRTREAAWGTEVMGVPFGSPVPVCYYRADLLEKLGAKPPRTWGEYRKLAQLLADRKKLGDAAPPEGSPWTGAIEPLGPGWAGIMLLARAAPYATHRANYSTLFKIDTMEPLVDGPPFVRALEELVAAAASGPAEQLRYDPAAVRRAFWRGECGLALTWPSAADKEGAGGKGVRVGFAELPGSREVFNVSSRSWETRQEDEEPFVPLLSAAGRVGTVTARSQWPEASFRLLFWLSGDEWSRTVSPRSPATTIFRRADADHPQDWVEKEVPAAAAAEYGGLIRRALNRHQALLALRIPGRAEYLKALDEAVQQSVRRQKEPQEALKEAAGRWREITARLGLQRQRAAYGHSLGL